MRHVIGVEIIKFALDLPEIREEDVISSYGVVTTRKYSESATSIVYGSKGFVSNFAYEISQHRCYKRELEGLVAKVAF